MQKKYSIISLLLVIAMCFSSVAFAASTNDAELYSDVQVEYEENYTLLNALGIFSDDLVRNIFSNEISKKAAYGYALELMGLNHDYHKLVDTLARNAGFMDKYEAYNPDAKLTPADAARVFVSVLGYNAQAQVKGGYLAYGEKLGIFDGVEIKGKSAVTYADFYKMIVNALDIKLSQIGKISNGNITYTTANNETVLSAYFGIKVVEGEVIENDLTTYYLPTNNGKNALVVNGVKYFYEDDHTSDLLGHNVRLYVKSDENNKVLYAAPYESTTLTITDVEFDNYKSNAITYYKNDSSKSKKARLVSKPKVLYNGVAYPNYTASDIKNFSGELVLIDNDDNGVYDIIKINDYTYGFVDTVNTTEMAIRFLKPSKTYLSLANYDEDQVSLYNADGDKVIFAYILDKDFLCIAESKTKHKCTIIVNRDTFEGTVDEKDDDVIRVDNVDYDVAPYAQAEIAKLAIGTNYKFYLDNSGRIVGYEKGSVSDAEYAFIMAAVSNGTLSTSCKAKILTSKGEIRELDFADKVTIDGKSVKNSSIIPAITGKNGSVRQLVKIKTNADNKIVFVDTSKVNANDGNDTLKLSTFTSFKGEYRDNYGKALFGGKVIANKNTVYFVVPKVQSSDPGYVFSDDEYAVGKTFADAASRNVLENTGDYVDFVDLDEHRTCNVVVYYKNTPIEETEKVIGNGVSLSDPANARYPVMIREIRQTVDDNGSKAYKVIIEKTQHDGNVLNNAYGAYSSGFYISFLVPERDVNMLWKKVYDADLNVVEGAHKMIEAGDIVQFQLESVSQKIKGSYVVYDASLSPVENARILNKNKHNVYGNGLCYLVGAVNWVDNDGAMSAYVTFNEETNDIDLTEGSDYLFWCYTTYPAFDTELREVYQIDSRNIKDVNTCPNDYDYVLICSYAGDNNATYVIH